MFRSSDACAAKPTLHGRLAQICGQSVLFSPEQRTIFALNQTAADIWRCLEEGAAPEAISIEMARGGVAPADADRFVAAALAEWRALDLIRPGVPPVAASREDAVPLVSVGGVRFRIVSSAGQAWPGAGIFRHLEIPDDAADVQVQLVVEGDRVHLFRDGRWMLSCAPSEAATMIKGQLLAEVLDRGGYELALHAAALRREGRILLLSGSPGAGKTTLTMALAHAGFGFAGDDVALIDAKGHCLGLPFAPAVKAGGWRLLAEACPELAAAPVFRRPDRRRVRYPVPKRFEMPSPLPVGWVVLLRRDRDAPGRLEPVDAAGALRGLLNGAFAVQGALTDSAFDVLVGVVRTAGVFTLSYSGLEDAVALLKELTGDARG